MLCSRCVTPSAGDHDFGNILAADWEYVPNYKVPLIRTQNSEIDSSPQNFVPAQVLKIRLAGFKYTLVREGAKLQRSIQGAQDAYPENYTLKNPESRGDDFFVTSLLNGFSPALPTKDESSKYHVRYNLDNYDWDGVHQSPSVHLTLEKDADEELIPIKIEYRLRDVSAISSAESRFSPWVSVTPQSDHRKWEKAKEYFRIAEFIDGQVKGHLGRGHINVGQYAIALYRNLQKSPILKLLHPHLKGVSAINTFGKEIIFGDSGVLALSPLTGESLIAAISDDLGQCDWSGWTPRAAISQHPQHVYAKIQKIYWEIIHSHIDHFFDLYEEKIKLDWKEIYHFSEDLVRHSVPFKAAALPDGESWYNDNEFSDRQDDGKAISWITQVTKDPSEEDVQNLKQVCAYAIYHATMWHDWRNDSQKKYAGEVEYARLSVDYSVEDTAFQLFIVNILTEVRHGYILKNEEGDIPSELILRLKERMKDFQALGYDIRDLRSRLNI